MQFYNFGNFAFNRDMLSVPLTIKIPKNNRDKRDAYGQPPLSYEKHLVNEPLMDNTSPNMTYQTTPGGQYSIVNAVWESLAIKNAPRGTIVIDSHGTKYKVVSKTQVTATNLWYYYLKVVGDRD